MRERLRQIAADCENCQLSAHRSCPIAGACSSLLSIESKEPINLGFKGQRFESSQARQKPLKLGNLFRGFAFSSFFKTCDNVTNSNRRVDSSLRVSERENGMSFHCDETQPYLFMFFVVRKYSNIDLQTIPLTKTKDGNPSWLRFAAISYHCKIERRSSRLF